MTDLHEKLVRVTEATYPDDVPDIDNWSWGTGPGRYERAPYFSPFDGAGGYRDRPATVLRMIYRPFRWSVWVENMNYIAIRYGADWNPEYADDTDGEERYMVGGPLIDPIVTSHLGTVLNAIREQAPRVKDGVVLNRIFEVIHYHRHRTYGRAEGVEEYVERYRDGLADMELPDPFDDDVDGSSPIGTVDGVGRQTIGRFASRFAVYPNLIPTEQADFEGILPGFHHSPDLDKMRGLLRVLQDYYDEHREDEWPDPERLDGYPSGNPMERGEL